jgi:hypothetical protein
MKRNGFAFAAIAIVVVISAATTVVFVKSRSKTANACINNLRPYPPEAYAEWGREEAKVLSIVPAGSTFSNVVAALGTNFVATTNYTMVYSANFKCKLPSTTNLLSISFRVDESVSGGESKTSVQHLWDSYSPSPSETYKEHEEKIACIQTIQTNVPQETTFSKLVTILGTNYTTTRSAGDEIFYAVFNAKILRAANLTNVTFRVQNNIAEWMPMLPPLLYSQNINQNKAN